MLNPYGGGGLLLGITIIYGYTTVCDYIIVLILILILIVIRTYMSECAELLGVRWR